MRPLVLSAALLALADSVCAQEARTPTSGDRVRVRHSVIADGEVKRVLMTGRLDSVLRDTVFLPRRPIALSNVSNVELSIGRQPNIALDASIGLILGAVVGKILVNRKVNQEVFQTRADLDARKRELRSTIGIAALIGAGAGAAVGKRGHGAWIEIDLNTWRAALSAGPR